MSVDNSTAFNEWGKRMPLVPDPAASDATSLDISTRLKLVLAQCQTDSEIDRELWDDFEVHRRSADTYINRYLDCLAQVHEERSRQVYENKDSENEALPTDTDMVARGQELDAAGLTRVKWRLKIMSDSLSRDLLAMHETLELLRKRASSPSPKKPSPCLCMDFILWQHSYRVGALGVVTTNVAGVTCYYSFEIWGWLRIDSIQRGQRVVQALLRRLKRGELDEQNRVDLESMSFWMVDRFRK
ncbi:hypothetical protein BKA65DRAFT_587255 [Rhexocercosporidium sp. MPI-PUGE-AT-0058]|nr:hypothetical protein BKA65DRAFT_587255 [Rhexocercosporidium sp. MPI-PUGE-AT-0058]